MSGLVEYPLPLGRGRFGSVRLPSDVTPVEIDRACRIMRALGPDIDEQERLTDLYGSDDPPLAQREKPSPEEGQE